MLMMHTASEMLRAISPVAGVIIIVAGFAQGKSAPSCKTYVDSLRSRLYHYADCRQPAVRLI